MWKWIFLGWNFLAPLATVGALWIFIDVAKDIIAFFSTLKLSNYSAAPSSCRVYNVTVKTIYVPSGDTGGSNLVERDAEEERFLSFEFIYQQQHQQAPFTRAINSERFLKFFMRLVMAFAVCLMILSRWQLSLDGVLIKISFIDGENGVQSHKSQELKRNDRNEIIN